MASCLSGCHIIKNNSHGLCTFSIREAHICPKLYRLDWDQDRHNSSEYLSWSKIKKLDEGYTESDVLHWTHQKQVEKWVWPEHSRFITTWHVFICVWILCPVCLCSSDWWTHHLSLFLNFWLITHNCPITYSITFTIYFWYVFPLIYGLYVQ